ncbi:uncharacterized protein JN550_001556 [Neoarthrinium moseri]|nr:uncharacterized protein JN550_001556 [Neoarthrinium moseri]KAI1876060.1 hypothetical protein JN550_001556 [Neoarthrinium moseri]
MDETPRYGTLEPSSDTLDHLPGAHRRALTAVGTTAMISFISTTTLFCFLTYKLLMGRFERWQESKKEPGSHDLTFGFPDRHYPPPGSSSHPPSVVSKPPAMQSPRTEQPRNPFPIFIYNLLLAEMQTAMGYTLNIHWVVRDGIYVGTSTCWTQGWLNNIGILAGSIFFVSISINTYLAVVRGWRPPQWFTHSWIVFCWLLALVLSSAGIIQTDNGKAEGGWFVRANTWCWVNSRYFAARLWGEWAWVLASIPVTIILYCLVFWSLYHEKRSSRHLPRGHDSSAQGNQPSGHHPAFLIYPFIYIACTSPLAIARLVTISGGNPSVTYYCIAGLILASNGLWNTILWSTTMLISTPEDMRDTGLDKFAFMRTPFSRRYGNMIWIEGPASRRDKPASSHSGWWWWSIGGESRWKTGALPRGPSQESLRRDVPGNCIQMDVITTVVVEENVDTLTETIRSAYASTSEKGDEEQVTPRGSIGKF